MERLALLDNDSGIIPSIPVADAGIGLAAGSAAQVGRFCKA